MLFAVIKNCSFLFQVKWADAIYWAVSKNKSGLKFNFVPDLTYKYLLETVLTQIILALRVNHFSYRQIDVTDKERD